MELIVNADDFGRSHDVNLGIVEAFKRGLINSTTLMVNMPFVDEAVELSKQYGFFDNVGLHLNLTEGKPISDQVISLPWVCTNGEFNNNIRFYLRRHFMLTSSEKNAIKNEIEAQLVKYINYGFERRHLDSHHHVHNEYHVFSCIRQLNRLYSFKSIRIARNLMPYDNLLSILKLQYKILFNYIVRRTFETTNYFGSYDDFKTFSKSKLIADNCIEIMVHPILHDNKLYDIVDEILIDMDNYNYNCFE